MFHEMNIFAQNDDTALTIELFKQLENSLKRDL